MSKLDDLKHKAKEMVTENRDRIEDGLEKAGDMINARTGGKYEEKIEGGLEKAKQGLDRVDTSEGDAPAATTTPDPGHSAAPPTALLDDATVAGSAGPPGTNGASVDADASETHPGR
jgi:hypothetical protein